MPRRFLQLLLTGVLLAAAAGCGQKGPLYLPDEEDRPAEQSRPAE